MQGLVSDKTFHLKWNNHLQNLSQLFTTIYSSSALADVTLSCRDGTLKAHKLVLSACSPYFEQIFKDNPCQHPIVILKGIPFSEINLLVEFMYKGSVDVQELDLQSLMHTASELEIRGLAYEARDNAAQMLNVNLNEYPTYPVTSVVPVTAPQQNFPQAHTDVERLKQIHMYQQSMMRAEEVRRRRRDEPGTHTVVNNILAAAVKEMEEARNASMKGERVVASIQTEHGDGQDMKKEMDEDRPKKRVSILTPNDDQFKAKKKPPMTVRFSDEHNKVERPNKTISPGGASSDSNRNDTEHKPSGIKVVQLSALQKPISNDNDDSDDKAHKSNAMDDDEETDSSDSFSDSAQNDSNDGRPHVCTICDLRFQRASHLSRHRLTHTGERPFTCGGCGRSFARSDKLRVHNKICERDDPTVDMSNDQQTQSSKRENSEMMSGMVRTSHRESGHLVFTPSGDVMLPPRAVQPQPVVMNNSMETARDDPLEPPRRGRGRPRKTPLPLTPKIKKRRGRPPKTSLDMEGCVLTAGSHVTMPSGQQLLLKRKRGRPPKNYLVRSDGRPNENYNASNLPFGDFSYLTDMIYNPLAYNYSMASIDPDRSDDQSADTSRDPTIDVSDSSSDDDDARMDGDDHADPRVMTVGDCQIVKLPVPDPTSDPISEAPAPAPSAAPPPPAAPQSVTITPIAAPAGLSSLADCTIRPLDSST